MTKLVAALQGQALRSGAASSCRRQRNTFCHGQHPPALLLRVAVPEGSCDVEVQDGHAMATFLQWPLVCKALLRGLAGAPMLESALCNATTGGNILYQPKRKCRRIHFKARVVLHQ